MLTNGDGSVGADPASPYHYGDVITLTATADPGWTFTDWSDNVVTTTNPFQITIYGDMVVTATFELNAPTAPTLVSPSGITSDTTPTYSWQEAVAAADYQLYLRDQNGQFVYSEWVSAAAVCAAGTCNYTPAPALDEADYSWYVRASNSAGTSPWSPILVFSIFTGSAAPGPATLLTPNNTIADTTPTFS